EGEKPFGPTRPEGASWKTRFWGHGVKRPSSRTKSLSRRGAAEARPWARSSSVSYAPRRARRDSPSSSEESRDRRLLRGFRTSARTLVVTLLLWGGSALLPCCQATRPRASGFAQGSTLLLSLKTHTDAVMTAEFSPDSTRVATASDDKTAKVWDAETGKLLA